MEFAYVGSYTTKKRGGLGQGGISVFRRLSREQKWEEIQIVSRMNPSFLTLGKKKHVLYTVQSDGECVAAYAINEQDGSLQLLNERKIGFHNGVFLQTDQEDNFLVVSACSGGNDGGIVTIRLFEDGSLGDIAGIEIPTGELGPLRAAQNAVKPHQTRFTPDYRYLVEIDKGTDSVNTYTMDDEGILSLRQTLHVRPGSCPRHIAFHPNGKFAYLLTEWFGNVMACCYEDGIFMPLAIVPTLPPDFLGAKNSAAEIEVHPNGRFLYASNREHSSIASFEIGLDGLLTPIGWCTEQITKPRFFAISKDGTELYVANEKGHNVTRYLIDPETGELTYADADMIASAPACIVFTENKKN